MRQDPCGETFCGHFGADDSRQLWCFYCARVFMCVRVYAYKILTAWKCF